MWRGKATIIQCPGNVTERRVWVEDRTGEVLVHFGAERIACRYAVPGKHQTITRPERHPGNPLVRAAANAKPWSITGKRSLLWRSGLICL